MKRLLHAWFLALCAASAGCEDDPTVDAIFCARLAYCARTDALFCRENAAGERWANDNQSLHASSFRFVIGDETMILKTGECGSCETFDSSVTEVVAYVEDCDLARDGEVAGCPASDQPIARLRTNFTRRIEVPEGAIGAGERSYGVNLQLINNDDPRFVVFRGRNACGDTLEVDDGVPDSLFGGCGPNAPTGTGACPESEPYVTEE